MANEDTPAERVPYLELQGTQLFYECQGEGSPPLVFVHGYQRDDDVDTRIERQAFASHRAASHQLSQGREPDTQGKLSHKWVVININMDS